MASKQMEAKRETMFCPPGSKPKPAPRTYPILESSRDPQQESSRWVHALFTIDFSKTKKQLRKEFEKWLELPENKARLSTHKKNPTGKTGAFKDRLKAVAVWRLYRVLGWEDALSFADKNVKRNKAGKPRKFHDHRSVDANTKKLYDAPLYSILSGESSFQKAAKRALDYRAELIPWEFGKFTDEWEKRKQEIVELYNMTLAEQQKISKSSS
jgi:hypothetical protein